ncbi:GPW/gp25 family protein [Bartonella sp. CB60]|uniref:GPW/gp25 family protein n=1 Tax=Bartonella sp. CB60 TaxID=3113619 RepID=UPI00300E01E0
MKPVHITDIGMCRITGKPLLGIEHLRQSIVDILMTRIGTRIMRRSYGANVADLIDNPQNDSFSVDIVQAIATALGTYEPRLALQKVIVKRNKSTHDGKIILRFDGIYLPTNEKISLDDVVLR